jgi:peptidoglycan/xylan/chitin deacetylase (PgdA/CDA1 family)
MRGRMLLHRLFRSFRWRMPAREKILYLTFDDGPVPAVTPWVLGLLEAYRAKATFFCVGENVTRHPEIYRELLTRGHATGNHTYRHRNGWMTSTSEYIADAERCREVVGSRLFRPPYGKIRPSQVWALRNNYELVMWDVLSKDYDVRLTGRQCLERVVRTAGPGSIVVFHDSVKAAPRLREALPGVLSHFHALGYRFEALPGGAPSAEPGGVQDIPVG